MNKKRNIIIVIAVSILVIVGFFSISNDKSVDSFKDLYFEMVEDDIKKNETSSSELKEMLEGYLLDTRSGFQSTIDKDGNEKSYETNIYNFNKEKEVLEVGYIEEDNKDTSKIDYILYQASKDEYINPYIFATYANIIDNPSMYALNIHLDKLEEQQEVINAIKSETLENKAYKFYYELAKYSEDNKIITIKEIEDLVGKKLEKTLDTNEYDTDSHYTFDVEYDNVDIVYNEDLKKIKSVHLFAQDNIYLSYIKEESKPISMSVYNKDLKEQKKMLEDVLEVMN